MVGVIAREHLKDCCSSRRRRRARRARRTGPGSSSCSRARPPRARSNWSSTNAPRRRSSRYERKLRIATRKVRTRTPASPSPSPSCAEGPSPSPSPNPNQGKVDKAEKLRSKIAALRAGDGAAATTRRRVTGAATPSRSRVESSYGAVLARQRGAHGRGAQRPGSPDSRRDGGTSPAAGAQRHADGGAQLTIVPADRGACGAAAHERAVGGGHTERVGAPQPRTRRASSLLRGGLLGGGAAAHEP